jgi:hypothetical protein
MDEAKPSAEVKEAVRDAARIRGEIITSFAQIEFVLADIVVKCASRAEYKNLVARFPYKVESRTGAVKALVKAPGPASKARRRPIGSSIIFYLAPNCATSWPAISWPMAW